MSKRRIFFALGPVVMLSLAGATLAVAMGMGMMNNMGMSQRGMMGGIPEPYAEMHNPLPATQQIVDEGKRLYETNCLVCHGAQGYGDGPAGAQLTPPPADLSQTVHMPMRASDGFLMWTISDGGGQLGSAMPAFKQSLSEQDRWKIIDYLRTL
jgi:mono/diheme cytochrome c family protein